MARPDGTLGASRRELWAERGGGRPRRRRALRYGIAPHESDRVSMRTCTILKPTCRYSRGNTGCYHIYNKASGRSGSVHRARRAWPSGGKVAYR